MEESHPVHRIALTSQSLVETQRAGLHFLTTLCEVSELSKEIFLTLFNTLLPFVNANPAQSTDPLLVDKVCIKFPLILVMNCVGHIIKLLPSVHGCFSIGTGLVFSMYVMPMPSF